MHILQTIFIIGKLILKNYIKFNSLTDPIERYFGNQIGKVTHTYIY